MIIIAAILAILGCSSTHSISKSTEIPFGQQYVIGTVARLSDTLFSMTRMDTIAITQFDPILNSTSIDLHVIQMDSVIISFYDSNGQFVNNAYRNYLPPGIYMFKSTEFHANTGIYFIKCQVGNKHFVRKTLINQ